MRRKRLDVSLSNLPLQQSSKISTYAILGSNFTVLEEVTHRSTTWKAILEGGVLILPSLENETEVGIWLAVKEVKRGNVVLKERVASQMRR